MESYFEPVLSEEQLAAYLDGMLSDEESNMVEEQISSTPEMEEILEAVDAVDNAYIYESDNEVPIECQADDFSLPVIDEEYIQSDDSYAAGDHYMAEEVNDSDSYFEEKSDLDFSDDLSDIQEENFTGEGYDDIAF